MRCREALCKFARGVSVANGVPLGPGGVCRRPSRDAPGDGYGRRRIAAPGAHLGNAIPLIAQHSWLW